MRKIRALKLLLIKISKDETGEVSGEKIWKGPGFFRDEPSEKKIKLSIVNKLLCELSNNFDIFL